MIVGMNKNGEYPKSSLLVYSATVEFWFCRCRFSKPVIFQMLGFQSTNTLGLSISNLFNQVNSVERLGWTVYINSDFTRSDTSIFKNWTDTETIEKVKT